MSTMSTNKRTVRLAREMERMKRNLSSGVTCFPRVEDNFDILDAQILGPINTPFEGGIFHVEVNIPNNYPFEPPMFKFITPVYHPNIDTGGRICLDLLKGPPKGAWRPTCSVESLLVAIQGLLEYPNPEDPLMFEIAELYKFDLRTYVDKAKQYTEKYAKKIPAKSKPSKRLLEPGPSTDEPSSKKSLSLKFHSK